jgi:membrane protein required for colicin V production
MNWVDIVLFFALAVAVFAGLARGVVREALNLGTIVLAIVVSGFLYRSVADLLVRYITEPAAAGMWAFVATLAVAGLIISTLRDLVFRSLIPRSLGIIDRLAGGGLALISGSIALTTVLSLILANPFWGLEAPIRSSYLAKSLIERTDITFQLLPQEFRLRHRTGALPLGASPTSKSSPMARLDRAVWLITKGER